MSKAASASQAIDRYTKPLQLALSCITKEVWVVGERGAKQHVLTIPAGPVATRTHLGALYFEASQKFEIYSDGQESRVRTLGYMYTISDSQSLQTELISWHWHPRTSSRPHLHIKETAYGHMPSGRVTFEAVVRYMIEELAVRPARKDWPTVLSETEALHARYRSWSVDPTIESDN